MVPKVETSLDNIAVKCFIDTSLDNIEVKCFIYNFLANTAFLFGGFRLPLLYIVLIKVHCIHNKLMFYIFWMSVMPIPLLLIKCFLDNNLSWLRIRIRMILFHRTKFYIFEIIVISLAYIGITFFKYKKLKIKQNLKKISQFLHSNSKLFVKIIVMQLNLQCTLLVIAS